MSEYEPEEYDPGPAVDDEGGMSEYRPDWSEVEWAEWERDHEPTRNGDLSERCAGERLPPFDHIPGVDPWTREPDEWSEVDRLAAEREAWGGEPPGPGCYPYADWVAEGRQEGPEAGA